MKEKKIVFCGGGNMAAGIIGGLIGNGGVSPETITVSELLPARCDELKETYGVNATPEADESMKNADVIVIAVLPKIVPVAAKQVKANMKENALIISIAAGVPLADFSEYLGAKKKVVRVMPNTLNAVQNGYSAVALNRNVTEEDEAYVTEFLECLGQVLRIHEDMFPAFTAFSCSGPMWLYKITESLVDAGVYAGFSRADATSIVLKNMLGVSQVLEESGESPSSKVNAMCSPGGVTIEGLKVMEEKGIKGALMDSVIAAVSKAKQL